MLFSLILALASPETFTISDTTDNISGERTVYALQLAGERTTLGFLYLRCQTGKPTLTLNLYDVPDTEYAVITVEENGKDRPTPLAFYKTDDLSPDLAYAGDSELLVRELAKSQVVVFAARHPNKDYFYSFDMAGIDSAWARVKQHCKPVTPAAH